MREYFNYSKEPGPIGIFDSGYGFPVTDAKGHGIGIRSIRSFCERNHAQAEFKIEGNLFALRILIQK